MTQMPGIPQQQAGRVPDQLISAAGNQRRHRAFSPAQPASCAFTQQTRQRGISHGISALRRRYHGHGAAPHRGHADPGQITPAKTRSASGVVRTDRWFPGPAAVATSRDGHVLAGAAQSMDACTGEVTIMVRESVR